jgi:hypothetical protein
MQQNIRFEDVTAVTDTKLFNPLTTEELFWSVKCENKNDENSRSLTKPLNIGTHFEALETSFQMVPLAF